MCNSQWQNRIISLVGFETRLASTSLANRHGLCDRPLLQPADSGGESVIPKGPFHHAALVVVAGSSHPCRGSPLDDFCTPYDKNKQP